MEQKASTVAAVCARCNMDRVRAFGIDDAIFGQIVGMLIGQILKCFGMNTEASIKRRVERKTNTAKKRARFVEKTEKAIQEYYDEKYEDALPDAIAEDLANAFIDECLHSSESHVERVSSLFLAG